MVSRGEPAWCGWCSQFLYVGQSVSIDLPLAVCACTALSHALFSVGCLHVHYLFVDGRCMHVSSHDTGMAPTVQKPDGIFRVRATRLLVWRWGEWRRRSCNACLWPDTSSTFAQSGLGSKSGLCQCHQTVHKMETKNVSNICILIAFCYAFTTVI